MDQAAVPPPHGTVCGLGCSNTRPPPAQTRPESRIRPRRQCYTAVYRMCTVNAQHNGFDVTDAVFNVRSSIRRVFEHHMIPAEVCDGQDPIHSTLYGRDIDITVTRHPCIHKV